MLEVRSDSSAPRCALMPDKFDLVMDRMRTPRTKREPSLRCVGSYSIQNLLLTLRKSAEYPEPIRQLLYTIITAASILHERCEARVRGRTEQLRSQLLS